ncbi:hypothetical protein A2872_03265 [Candidatus Gottesmanbacteria bacterium RIFCSPHIGHO2_01_FULL_42_12]|uniref:Uncharacterized protein n=1 Tax=Candidatus Gottesmanbacteria bacterium RIFCSPHIGHO2_01_FULL_42_12 TaxID=1798377 RepID=A0A1F5Z6B0_9BACT|nr:MAG: hypothetical protein A2872_03265 [Candidatus Gottesmanbacteria bacterium RIFCSPHIGHO2_01_FULL_42_12]
MIKNTPLTKADVRKVVEEVLEEKLDQKLDEKLREKLEPVMVLLNTVLKEIQDFREESAIFRSLHSRVLDLEDIHPNNTHSFA